VIQILAHQHLREKQGRRDALVDDVWRHRGLDQGFASRADPFASDVALHREHSRLVVELLGHVLSDALEGASTGAGGALGLVVDLAPRQVCGQ